MDTDHTIHSLLTFCTEGNVSLIPLVTNINHTQSTPLQMIERRGRKLMRHSV